MARQLQEASRHQALHASWLNHVSTIKKLRGGITELEHEVKVQKQKRLAESEAMKENCKRLLVMYKKQMQQEMDDLNEQFAASKAQVTELEHEVEVQK
jgi:hypothetical protein